MADINMDESSSDEYDSDDSGVGHRSAGVQGIQVTASTKEESDTEESEDEDHQPVSEAQNEAGDEHMDTYDGEDTDTDESDDESEGSESSEDSEEDSDDESEESEEEEEEDPAIKILKDRKFYGSQYDGFATNAVVCLQSPTGPWYEIAEPKKCTCFSHRKGIPGSMVIAVDGSCNDNGKQGAKASSAVFFHPANAFNRSARLEGKVQNSQHAELNAALMALRAATDIKKRAISLNSGHTLVSNHPGPMSRLHRILITTDYEPLVMAMTRQIYLWRTTGFLSRKNKPIPGRDILEAIDDAIENLNEQGVRVQFWHVNRSQNAMADYIAKARLKNVTPQRAMERWSQSNLNCSAQDIVPDYEGQPGGVLYKTRRASD